MHFAEAVCVYLVRSTGMSVSKWNGSGLWNYIIASNSHIWLCRSHELMCLSTKREWHLADMALNMNAEMRGVGCLTTAHCLVLIQSLYILNERKLLLAVLPQKAGL